MTSKTKNFILIGSQTLITIALCAGILFMDFVDTRDHSVTWALCEGAIFILIVVFNSCLLPKLLGDNIAHLQVKNHANERIVLNGKSKIGKWIAFSVIGMCCMIFIWVFYHMAYTTRHSIPTGRHFYISVIVVILTFFPLYVEMGYRLYKNTYTIEGHNLIIDEWSWFRQRTRHLVIPIANIQSVRKVNLSLWQCNIEIQVAGVKRKLHCGLVGNDLFNVIKNITQ